MPTWLRVDQVVRFKGHDMTGRIASADEHYVIVRLPYGIVETMTPQDAERLLEPQATNS